MTSSARTIHRRSHAKTLAVVVGSFAAVTMGVLGTVVSAAGGGTPGAGEAAGTTAMTTGSTSTVVYSGTAVPAFASPTVTATYFGGMEP